MIEKLLFEPVNAISFVQIIAGLDASEELSGEFEFMTIAPIGEKNPLSHLQGLPWWGNWKLLIKSCLQF